MLAAQAFQEAAPPHLRLLVVDDHALMREGISSLLDEHRFKVVGYAADGVEAIRLYDELKPDVVLMDLKMPRKGGLDAARDILTQDDKAKIIMLTVELCEPDVMRAVDMSIKGYLLKTTGAEGLNHALSLVARGESVFPSDALSRGFMVRRESPQGGLTGREGEILRRLSCGLSNKQIARELEVTEGTVKVHIKSILKKLGLNNRTQAAIYAYEHHMN